MKFARKKSSKKMGFLNSIFFIIFLVTSFYQSMLRLPIVAAKNFLLPGDALNSLDTDSTLLSARGMFTLGFFTASSTNNLTYLGIWYTNEKQGIKVWVANRDIPIIGYGVLSMNESGTLEVKVINGDDTTSFTVSNAQVRSGNNPRAVLEDSGNFLVYDESHDNRTIWQSFDHPVDMLLPGMKLGYNQTTKQNWKLTSWADKHAPASGAFTMTLERYHNSPQLLIYRRGELYWASGPWKNGSFQFLYPDMAYIDNYRPAYVLISDSSSMYLIVQELGSDALSLQLSPQGQLQFMDNVNTFTQSPDFCSGYQSEADGCVVSALPNCRPRYTDWNTVSYISGPGKYDDNSSISLGDCMERCWNDCTCIACSTNSNGTGCITWTDKHDSFFGSGESDDSGRIYVLVSYIPPKKRIWRWILVSIAILVTSALTTFLCYVRIRRCLLKAREKRRRDDYLHQLRGSDSFNYGDEFEKGIKEAPDVKIFSLKAILTATDNFSNENKLGQGGYGPVYKGKLLDGREIAVKKLSKTSGQGLEEFRSELILISKLQHTNLVRLYGCCIHHEEKMLIYEFMPNKSLDFFLFAEDEKEKLDWPIRFDIIEGIAQGLLYLHKYSRMKVIHRDLKVSNVLLDENMNPKIADFGMARIFKHDMTEDVTNRVVGTYGYMAPEYALEGTISVKTDVFSFGVLMLEIISGRRNSSFYNPDRPLNLVGYAWELWKGHASLELKDETLGESFDVKQLLRAIHIGLICVQENADDRPDISDVIYILKNETVDLPSPKQPAFFTGRQTAGFRLPEARSTDYLLAIPNQVSENGLTVTTMEAR